MWCAGSIGGKTHWPIPIILTHVPRNITHSPPFLIGALCLTFQKLILTPMIINAVDRHYISVCGKIIINTKKKKKKGVDQNLQVHPIDKKITSHDEWERERERENTNFRKSPTLSQRETRKRTAIFGSLLNYRNKSYGPLTLSRLSQENWWE